MKTRKLNISKGLPTAEKIYNTTVKNRKEDQDAFVSNLKWLFASNLLTKEEKNIVFKRLENSIVKIQNIF